MNEFPNIYTDRLVLRNFHVDDINHIYEIFSDSQVVEFYDLDKFTDIEQARHYLKARITLNQEFGQRAFRWAVCMQTDPERVIGSCGFHGVNKSFHSIEIGYELNSLYWGKNIAFEAVSGMLNYCINKQFPFSINRISATTDLASDRSIRLLHRLGFVEEGILRQYGYWKGNFHDVRLFSLLSNEWKAKEIM